ncbi:hypothetical protein [Streptomyces sp. NPDC049906]|uniref:hypothetical protein n=1 Tax=Streptomyces sp. NPDC049906 TaxID=3155656 RepID=UPI003414B8E2
MVASVLVSAVLSASCAGSLAAGVSVQVLVSHFGRRVLRTEAPTTAAAVRPSVRASDRHGTAIRPRRMVPPLVLMGVGRGLAVAPSTEAILSEVPCRTAGSVSGLFNTVL